MKRIIIILLFITLFSCTKVETFKEESTKWLIEYCVNSNHYTFEFNGKDSAYYKIIKVEDFNVLLIYPDSNITMVNHVFKSKDEILILRFLKIS